MALIRFEDEGEMVAQATLGVVTDFLDGLDAHDRALLGVRLISSLEPEHRVDVLKILNREV